MNMLPAMPLRPWLLASRPKTLAAGAVPVAVGTALAGTVTAIDWAMAGGCLVGALLIQIGCNFANDAFDALSGADTAARQGPTRAVAAGLITPRAMFVATGIVLLLALAVGLWLASVGGWPILALGVISLLCAVAYTGGPFPLAYVGLGDLFVLLFFGLFAVLGSAWIQVADAARELPIPWWCVASGIGFQAAAIICVNNLRDIATDAPVGKRTVCVRLGNKRSRWYYLSLHLLAALAYLIGAAWSTRAHRDPLVLVGVIAAVGGILLAKGVFRATGSGLNVYLARSAALELVTGAALILALNL
jgi:1,4-dihydroxy-2-naphthoate polyprenyltransferase